MGDGDADIVMSRSEARSLVVGGLLGAPFFILTTLAFEAAYPTVSAPGTAFIVGFLGVVAIGIGLEPVRMRIRARSGAPGTRGSATSCG